MEHLLKRRKYLERGIYLQFSGDNDIPRHKPHNDNDFYNNSKDVGRSQGQKEWGEVILPSA